MKIIPVPCAFDNFAYLLICEESGVGAVIDPTEAYPPMQLAKTMGIKLTAVLCTHHHQDHTGGIEDLLSDYPELNIVGYRGDMHRISKISVPVEDGDLVEVGELEGRVLFTPGHTAGSICYHFADSLFTGDTLFGCGCGRLFEGTAEQMFDSLNHKICKLEDSTKIYFGHEYTEHNLGFAMEREPANIDIKMRLEAVQAAKRQGNYSSPSTLKEEKATNPFLRCHMDSVREHCSGAAPDATDVEIFRAIRLMRNSY